MRKPKMPPPSPTEPAKSPVSPLQKAGIDIGRSINAIEGTLLQCLPNDFGLTPQQFRDACDMVLTDLHFRAVTPEYWAKVSTVAMRGIALSCQITAEIQCSKADGMPEHVAKLLMDSAQLSLNEIKAVRVSLLDCVKQMTQCREPGTVVH